VENKLKRELPIELQLLQVLQIPWTSMNILRTISRLAINQTEYWCTVGEFWKTKPIFPHCWSNNNLCIYSKVQPWQILNILHVHHTPSSSLGDSTCDNIALLQRDHIGTHQLQSKSTKAERCGGIKSYPPSWVNPSYNERKPNMKNKRVAPLCVQARGICTQNNQLICVDGWIFK
jgi:hypothetical protein